MRGGDERQRLAFEAEMLPHLPAAYRLARILAGNEHDAEDLVQDAYLRAFSSFRTYQPGTHARAWLLTILRHVFLNDRRRLRSRPNLVPFGTLNDEYDCADPEALSIEEHVLQSIDAQAALRELATLPEPVRSALTLVDIDGLRYAEAAEILGCPIGTIMSRLHRGRLELARRLQTQQVGRKAV
jgi:RNA polymerase sigma-70 factor (ECF subfamily)